MVEAYWEIGRVIVEEEQAGKGRADYGKRILDGLSARLTAEFGKGFDPSNLRNMRAFFLTYQIRDALRHELSWTHYRLLLRVDDRDARTFYEAEAVNARWSTRELERQINALLFERLALSRDREGVLALARNGHEVQGPSDLVKDPYVLEFTGIRQDERYLEADFEQALIDKLQQFLLELGKGFAFMARQQRITIDGKHFFIDLVFYNRLTRSFVLLDLKVGGLTHQDLGQMQMYLLFRERHNTSTTTSASWRPQTRTHRSGSCCAPTRARRWSGTRCRRGISRSSRHGTNSTCRLMMSWLPRSSESGSRSSTSGI